MPSEFTRRTFLAESGKTALAGIATPLLGDAWRGANDKVGVAFIGVGGQGRANLSGFLRSPLCRVVGVCDVYAPHREQALKMAGLGAVATADYRTLLARKDVDAVVISTPDHWHAIPLIEACRAGKDVYAEKPLSLTISEGRAMVNAAKNAKRIVQVGTQQRSGRHFQEVVAFLKAGKLGKIRLVETWNLGGTGDLGRPADTAPPADLDWNRWLGPAPMRPYNVARCLYNFRWFWDYAGGQLSNWGVHLLDIARWATGVSAPIRVDAVGGIQITKDCRETPDTLDVTYTFPDDLLITFWHRAANALPPDNKHQYGIRFTGTEGTLFVDRTGWSLTEPGETRPAEEHPGSEQHQTHIANFLECVRSRQKPVSDIETGHLSTVLCHLGNIAYRTGRSLGWDAKNEYILDNPEGNRFAQHHYRAPYRI